MPSPDEIVLRLTLNEKEFNGKIQLASSEIKGLRGQADEMRVGLSGWAVALTGFNQGLELANKFMTAMGTPLDAASQFEKYEVQLKVMLGSTQAAKDRLAELVDFAATTPFELPEVVEAANKLQAVGMYSKELLTNLGDLAAASQKPMDQVMGAFQKLASGQKGIAVDMFRDMLISVDDWVQATGKGVKANGELEASYQEMMNAIPQIIKNKNFAGMMDEQSKTFAGLVSNMSDEMGKTATEIGQSFLPLAKEVVGTIIPSLSYLRENFRDIAPVVGVTTAAIVLYTMAARAQAIAEALTIASLKNSTVVLGVKNIALRFSAAAQDLAAASTLAFGVMQDLINGKITAGIAVQNLYRISTMALGSSMTLMGGALAVVGIAWGAYEMTVGKARNEMGQAEYQAMRTKLGLDKLQERLSTMSAEDMSKELKNVADSLADIEAKIKALKELNPTGSSFLDAIFTGGSSEAVNDQITTLENQKKAFEENQKSVKDSYEALTKAKEYTKNFTDESLKGLKSINAVTEAKKKFNLAFKDASTEEERKRLKTYIDQLEAAETKLTGSKGGAKKTREDLVGEKLKYYEELVKADDSYTEAYKKYLDEQWSYYSITLLKQKGSFKNFTSDQLNTLNDIREKLKKNNERGGDSQLKDGADMTDKVSGDKDFKDFIDTLQKKTDLRNSNDDKLKQAKIRAIADEYDREKAEIEKWYGEETELKLYRENAEYKAAIDQEYYNKKLELARREVIERDAVNGAILAGYDTFTENLLRTDMSGAEKKQAILSSVSGFFYRLLVDQLRQYIISKWAEVAVTETTEGTKTAVVQAGAGARMIVLGEEIIKTIVSAGASVLNAVAKVIEWQVAMFGPFALATIPASIGAIMAIFAGAKKALGFDQGGRLRKGESGYFEGYRNEIIAPEETFVEVMKRDLFPKIMQGMSVSSALNASREMMAKSMLNSGAFGTSASGGASDLKLLVDAVSRKLDDVVIAFERKQFAIKEGLLSTVQEREAAIKADLRF